MGFLDVLKNMGNQVKSVVDDVKICKDHFSSFDDEELFEMLRSNRFNTHELECNYERSFSRQTCNMGVKLVLKDRGYSQEYINSL